MPVIADMLKKYQEELATVLPQDHMRHEVLTCTRINVVSVLMDAKVNGLMDQVLPFLSGMVSESYRADLQDSYNLMMSSIADLKPEDWVAALRGAESSKIRDYNAVCDTLNHILAIAHHEDHFSGK